MRTLTHRVLLFSTLGVAIFATADARAQIAGTVNKPLPNVLLLVDNSGSMERMPNGTLPADNKGAVAGTTNVCTPGSPSNPNRWGMLIQALTGNLQPYYSCEAVDRGNGKPFSAVYSINGKNPYDTDYALPYHRPITGVSGAPDTTCTLVPYRLPGASGNGVGAQRGGYSSGVGLDAADWPSDAVVPFSWTQLNLKAGGAISSADVTTNTCLFDQARDGQLDAVQDFIRFGLMTFDSDPSPGTGVSLPAGSPAAPSGLCGGSILTTASNDPFLGMWSYIPKNASSWTAPSAPVTLSAPNVTKELWGYPAGCTTAANFEVGARHNAAPPWEGRMVLFPAPYADLLAVEKTNSQVQSVLVSSRPYGATPLDAMMDDARDYFYDSDFGPNGASPYKDDYVAGGCRDQYIIMLTDGAPNLNLRPACTGGVCPYPKQAYELADGLYQGNDYISSPTGVTTTAGRPKVQTFVIGFSVNGDGTTFVNDGFPAGLPTKTCKDWYAWTDATNGGRDDPKLMDQVCTSFNPPAGSTADACCQLNKVAYYGSGGNAGATNPIGPFFAESQADLVLSFSRILALVTKTASSRTTPAVGPTVTSSGTDVTATFVSSFVPNAYQPWSGEIDRTRSLCTAEVPTPQAQSTTKGDSYSYDLAQQSFNNKRYYITAIGDPAGSRPASPKSNGATAVDSARTMRPWLSGVPDGVLSAAYGSTEYGNKDNLLNSGSVANFASALDIDQHSCKASKFISLATSPPVAKLVPALTANDCADVSWGFAAAWPESLLKSGTCLDGSSCTFDFNVRCNTSGSVATGKCSYTGKTCSVATPTACDVDNAGRPIIGQVCVPDCNALGAIFRSNPTVVGAPSGFLREEGYRTYQKNYALRHPTMYVATTDGLLHAMKALETTGGPPFDGGAAPETHEFWSFVPPAVLPKLASNFPGGQQIVLDGSPVVRETVWERTADSASLKDPTLWHTTLVAGLGAAGAGYYALNVTDADCTGTGDCSGASGWQQPTTFAEAAGAKKGPHFLWQLTDVEAASSGEILPITRTAYDGKKFVSLFGKTTGTPAITTVQLKDGAGVQRQVGVAILPGGIDGSPSTGTCPRAVGNTYGGVTYANTLDVSDTSYKARTSVRNWSSTGDCNDPVPGRGVTIVRLDNGQILRHFGRVGQDVPKQMSSAKVSKAAPFDSPIVGTPVVYPNTVGAVAQKIFVGDADGTIWRIDVSALCDETDMSSCPWAVNLFQDLFSSSFKDSTGSASITGSQPIAVPMVLSQSPAGGIVVNAATGDQENLTASTDMNQVISIEEKRPLGSAKVDWYNVFSLGERVTGPMVAFDRILYFATYKPAPQGSATVCVGSSNVAKLWGVDYINPADAGNLFKGGNPAWCPKGSVDAQTGHCGAALVQSEDVSGLTGNTLIPGVTLQATQACTSTDSADLYNHITGVTPTEFNIFATTQGKPTGGNPLGTNQANRIQLKRPSPRISTTLDAWAFVID